jgi:hypothetical protein
MVDENTPPARPRAGRDSGPIAYQNGKLTVKLSVIVAIFGLLGLGGNHVLLKAAAPDPATVQKTANDVTEIKEALIKLGAAMENLARDRDSLKDQMDRQQRAIDDLKATVPTVREMDDLRNRVKRLEEGK